MLGVLRAELLESGQAVEADLRAEDLAGGFLVGIVCGGWLEVRWEVSIL